jgi:hypothetical protein
MKKLLAMVVMVMMLGTLYGAEKGGKKEAVKTKEEVTIYNGPFGFKGGLSFEEIEKMVGKENIIENDGSYILKKLPKSIDDFGLAICSIDKEKGLVRIMAITEDISSDSYGSVLRTRFNNMSTAIKGKYGEPANEFDFLRYGSLWNEDREFIMGILKKERTLATYWNLSENENKVKSIGLIVGANYSDAFYINLTYEFEGFDEYSDNKNKEKSENY